jgi:hypothetical protein
VWFSPARVHRALPDIEKYDKSRMRGEGAKKTTPPPILSPHPITGDP